MGIQVPEGRVRGARRCWKVCGASSVVKMAMGLPLYRVKRRTFALSVNR